MHLLAAARVTNPNKTVYGVGDTITVPPCGRRGVMARTDNQRPGGVYQPPAGVERGIIRGARGLEMTEVTSSASATSYPANINPITTGPGTPSTSTVTGR